MFFSIVVVVLQGLRSIYDQHVHFVIVSVVLFLVVDPKKQWISIQKWPNFACFKPPFHSICNGPLCFHICTETVLSHLSAHFILLDMAADHIFAQFMIMFAIVLSSSTSTSCQFWDHFSKGYAPGAMMMVFPIIFWGRCKIVEPKAAASTKGHAYYPMCFILTIKKGSQ